MDLESYWQENRRFVLAVAGGALGFLVAWWAIDGYLGSDLRRLESSRARLSQGLGEPMFQQGEQELAQQENEALRSAVTRLRAAVEFVPRERFAVPPGSAASGRYLAVVSDVREDLLLRAGRAGLSLPGDLGLPALAPTKDQEIVRTLEALDAIERALQRALEAGVERVDSIRIKLDPRLSAGKPIDDLEKTLVELRLSGPAIPLVRLIGFLQEPREGAALLVERAEVSPARARRDEVQLEIVLLVGHPHGLGAAAEADPEG